MAKVIKYKICSFVNQGTEEPNIEEKFSAVTVPFSEENEEIAKREAWGGEYTVEDDGQPEIEPQETQEERIVQLEQALDMLLNGVTE